MEQKFIFQINAMDLNTLVPEVSYTLERQVELTSRKKYPKMWALADYLNGREKAPEEIRKKRRAHRKILAPIDWIIGILLFSVGLVEPNEMLVPLLFGAFCYGVGVGLMWRYHRILLGILSLVQGIFFGMAWFGDPETMRWLLFLSIFGFVFGIASFVCSRKRPSKFERAAVRLLETRQHGEDRLQVIFCAQGMIFLLAGQNEQNEQKEVPFGQFERVIETENLLALITAEYITLLQKKDLIQGSLEDLQAFLKENIPYFT